MKPIKTKREKNIEIQNKAQEKLKKIMRELKAEMPELISAINIFKLYEVEEDINISTDFCHLFYNAKNVVQESKEEIVYQIMHVLLHGLLGHNELIKHVSQKKVLWLALDQKVNDILRQLGYEERTHYANYDRYYFMNKMKETSPYKECFGNYYLAKRNSLIRKKAKAAQRHIASDNHFYWNRKYLEEFLKMDFSGENASGNGGKGPDLKGMQDMLDGKAIPIDGLRLEVVSGKVLNGFNQQAIDKSWENARNIILGIGDSNDFSINGAIIVQQKMAGLMAGRGAGGGRASVVEITEEPMDYREIIENLLKERENSREKPDSIDPMLYQYGLELYEDMPLIEPREEDETKSLETLVIAIDTSGSCSGVIANRFVHEIKGILRDASEYMDHSKVMIVECDDAIQYEEIFETQTTDFEEMRPKLLSGFGGTCFDPVFQTITRHREELGQISALLYLTDGCGYLEEQEPDYPVYFIMNKNDMDSMRGYLPNWIQYGVIA